MITAPHIVIIGGGFGGFAVAKHLGRAEAHITLIDRRNFHLFQPLLYQVATGGLSPANISVPLRAALKHHRNTTVLLGEVTDINVSTRTVSMAGGNSCMYDYLVIATGSSHNYFGHPEWQIHAPGLKTVEDALEIRRRVLSTFEQAELESDPEKSRKMLRFIVVGGGPTGVELAGALGEIAHQTLKDNFRRINPADTEILLIEGDKQILSSYSPRLANKAKRALYRLGVTVRENTLVRDVQSDHVVVEESGKLERIDCHCVLWAAGVQASPLGRMIAEQTGATLDRAGRIRVSPDLSVPGHPNIFIIGDLALITHDNKPVPGVAPAAMQTGEYVAKLLQEKIAGAAALPGPFQFHDKGAMTTVGRSYAVVQLRRISFAGFMAWLLWLWVHIFYLTQFTNRILVVIQWGWSYFTRNRSARIITEEAPRQPLASPQKLVAGM